MAKAETLAQAANEPPPRAASRQSSTSAGSDDSDATVKGAEGGAELEPPPPTSPRDAREPSPVLKDMNNESIEQWCSLLQKRKHPFIGLDPDESLYVALERLLRHKVHGA